MCGRFWGFLRFKDEFFDSLNSVLKGIETTAFNARKYGETQKEKGKDEKNQFFDFFGTIIDQNTSLTRGQRTKIFTDDFFVQIVVLNFGVDFINNFIRNINVFLRCYLLFSFVG